MPCIQQQPTQTSTLRNASRTLLSVMLESEAARDAMALTTICSSDALADVLPLVMQQTKHKTCHDAAAFARLLCVSKQLQETMKTAGCLVASLTLSISQSFDNRFVRLDPEREARISSGQLARVSAQIQKGHITQLRLTGVSANSINYHREELIGLMPALGDLWTDLCSRYRSCFYRSGGTYGPCMSWPELYSSCDVLVDVKPHSIPRSPAHCGPQLSYTITRLTLGIEAEGGNLDAKHLWQPALKQLPQLTSLVELNMPVFNPPEGVLAPALSALTNLTKLFIRHPMTPEQQALPVSLKHLTVAREYEYADCASLTRLPALQLSHLTALSTLVIFERHWSKYQPQFWDNCSLLCEGVPAGSVLPVSLQHVEVKGVRFAQPLLALTQLKTLTITHGITGLRSRLEPECMAADTNVLLALTQLTSLTRVIIKGRRPTKAELQQDGLQAAFDALPADLSGLDPAADDDCSAEATDSIRGLLGMGVQGSRGCSLWAGVRALVEVLAIGKVLFSK